MNNIEKLAAAMGCDPNLFGPLSGNPIFDPRKDANHTEAVIRWLNKRHYDVRIWHSGNSEPRCNVACRVSIRHCTLWETHEVACDDWKQGVFELALEVLE